MERHFAACVAQLRDRQGMVCGAGFLIDRRHVMSCAHVVNRALGRAAEVESCPADAVGVYFPFAESQPLMARVVEWHAVVPYALRDARRLSDVAVLRLESEMPGDAAVALLAQGRHNGGQKLRCFGFPQRAGVAGETAEAISIAEDATGWLHLRQEPGFGPTITEGYSGAPLFDAGNGAVIGMITAFEPMDDPHQAALSYGTASRRLQMAWPPLARPYKGLAPFERGDAAYFFGREGLIEELRRRIQRENLVMIVGPSGGGKSSLVLGGLLPRLDEVAESRWLVAVLRPGIDPLAALAGAVARGLGDEDLPARTLGLAENLARHLNRDARARNGGARMLARLAETARHRGARARLLLVVDAFEELFDADSAGRVGFTALCSAISRQRADGNVCLLGTLRADFTGEMLRDAALSAALDGHYLMLRAMKPAELGRAIRLPARRLGVAFEAGVDDELLAAVARDPASLPLMEFVLERLWAEQRDHLLPAAAYERMGGLGGALALHADEILDHLPPAEQALARRLLSRLVAVAATGAAEDCKCSQTRAELGEDLWAIARRLAGETTGREAPARLVILSRDEWGLERAELIHEALLRHWPRLAQWLDEERSFLVLLGEWRQAWLRWQERSDRLLRGRDLDEALAQRARIIADCPELLEFLNKSDEAAREKRARIEADAIWERLEFQGGVACPAEREALDELTVAAPATRWMFLRRLFEMPQRARRFCRLPVPVIRAAIGADITALHVMILARLADTPPPEITAAGLYGLGAIGRDGLDLDLLRSIEGPALRAFAAWAFALAPRFDAERAAAVLTRLLDATDITDDWAAWGRAGAALAARLSSALATGHFAGMIRRIEAQPADTSPRGFQALGRIAQGLAAHILPEAVGGELLHLLSSIEACPLAGRLQALVAPAQLLAELLPAHQVAPWFDTLTAAIERALPLGRMRAPALILFALTRHGVACDRGRAEAILRNLWERRHDGATEALAPAALALAAGIDGLWAARVLDLLLEAINHTVGPDLSRALGEAAQSLAIGLEPDQAGRAFDYVVDLLDWTSHPDRQQALGSAAAGLAIRLPSARVAPGLERLIRMLAAADTEHRSRALAMATRGFALRPLAIGQDQRAVLAEAMEILELQVETGRST